MARKDYYQILGISKESSPAEIKSAYKKLAKKWHPDLNKDEQAGEKFKEISEAYSVLSDPQKKQMYDQYGSSAFGEGFQGFGGAGAGFDFSDLFGNSGFGNMEDLFRQAFGGGFGFGNFQNQRAQPQNIRVDIELAFEEAVFGTTKKIEIEHHVVCDVCNGTGSKNGKRETCDVCKGRGMETKTRRTPFGMFQTTAPCSKCGGIGEVVINPCRECEGDGIALRKNKIEIKIPEGVDNGNHLRISNQGHATPDGRKGDLFVVIRVKPSKIFKRDGSDVFIEHELDFAEAVLGGEVEVPILGNKTATVKIPSGTSVGKLFRLKGKGIKRLNSSGYGDQYVQVTIKVPNKISKRERELLEELYEIQSKDKKKIKKKKGFFGF
jgi:molecular chaperone DnaJ